MIIYFTVDNEGYLDGWGSTRSSEKDYELEVDPGHEFFKNDSHVYKFIDGELVKDVVKQQQLIEQAEKESQSPTAENMNAIAILELAVEIERIKEGMK